MTLLLRLVLSMLMLSAASAAAAATTEPSKAEPATLTLLNRDIVTLRATLLGATPAARVERARARIRQIPAHEMNEPLRFVEARLGEAQGVQFLLGDRVLFTLLHDDLDPEARQSFDDLVSQTGARLEQARAAWHQMQDRPLLLRGLLKILIASLVAAVLVWLVFRAFGVGLGWLVRWRDRLAAVHAHMDFAEFLARIVVGAVQLFQWFVLAAVAYAWVRFATGSFVATEPVARELDDWLWDKVAWVGGGIVDSLPGLVTVAIVVVLTRAIADAVGYVFDSIERGRLRLPLLHPETTSATRRIVYLLVYGIGLAVAYPYLPGASSEAFKGLSVLVGVMITLGSSGIVSQAMGGLVVIYSRALRKGDFVEVNGVQGVVSEVAALATKIVNVRNEEITIPNSVLISSPIRNYSKLAGSQGTLLSAKVTIGYDAPWRQVHALLIEAARRTQAVRATPAPFVYQRALSDFYVEYELFVSIDRPLERIPILSDLHANIQDEFNAHGVQIMSPHFFAQPPQPVVVPPEQWHAKPASPPT